MILRATSDLHLSQRTAEWVFNALRELEEDAKAHGGDTVLCGDLFEQGDVVHMPTWNRLRDLLHDFPCEVWIIPGNHDQYHEFRSALEGLDGENVHVIRVPMATRIGRMVPYVKPELFADTVAQLPPPPEGAPSIVWCHQGFKGAYMNTMIRDRDGVNGNAVPARHVTVTGHYHMPQNLGPLIYCGSPYETTFAEEGQRKSWLRWEDARTNPLPERVPYKSVGAPRHFTVHWDQADGPPVRPADATPNDIIRIVTKATKEEVAKATAAIVDAGLEGVPVIAQAPTVAGRGLLDPSWDLITAATEYAERANPELPLRDFAEEHKLWEGV